MLSSSSSLTTEKVQNHPKIISHCFSRHLKFLVEWVPLGPQVGEILYAEGYAAQ